MGRTQAEKLWLGGAALLAVLLAMIGYFLLIVPQRAQTATAKANLGSAQLQNSALTMRINTLTSQNKRIGSYERALRQAHQALPGTASVSGFLRTLQQIGATTGTSMSGVTVARPQDATSAEAAAPAGAAAPSSSASSSPAASSSTSTPAAGATGTTSATPTLVFQQIVATVTGSGSRLDRFLVRLQAHQPRAVLIIGIALGGATANNGQGGAASGGGQIAAVASAKGSTMQLTMDAFVAPPATDTNGTPATSPVPGATPSPTSTP